MNHDAHTAPSPRAFRVSHGYDIRTYPIPHRGEIDFSLRRTPFLYLRLDAFSDVRMMTLYIAGTYPHAHTSTNTHTYVDIYIYCSCYYNI